MSARVRLVLVALAMVVSSTPGAAQGPLGPPTAAVELAGVPTAPVDTINAVQVQPFTVDLRLGNLVCPVDTTFTVGLSAEASANRTDNLSVGLEWFRSELPFAVPAGEYIVAPYMGTRDVALAVSPDYVPKGGLDVAVNLTAALPAGNGMCQGTGTQAGAEATGAFVVRFTRSSPGLDAPEPSQVMPSAGLALLAVAFVGVAWTLRRSR